MLQPGGGGLAQVAGTSSAGAEASTTHVQGRVTGITYSTDSKYTKVGRNRGLYTYYDSTVLES